MPPISGMQGYTEIGTLVAAGTVVASTTTSAAVTTMENAREIVFQLDVSAAAGTNTLDVTIQTTIDGTNWVDVVHFTQIAGAGGAVRHFAKINGQLAQTMFENGTALSAGAVRNLLGSQYRASYVRVSSASITLGITYVARA